MRIFLVTILCVLTVLYKECMLYEVNWAEDGTYRPGEQNSPEKFFNDCLENSKEFDLQLGYFSSAAISVLADGFASFISNGGRMRLVINHIVSEKDKSAISKGVYGGIIDCFDLSDFEELRHTFDAYQQQFFECLAFLIYNKRIDIRIIKPNNKKGISHTKSGQFRDGDSITSFTGSANFTINGLFNNLEEIKIDRSDSVDMMVRKRISSQRTEFDSIMSGKKKGIEYLSPEKLEAAVVSNYGDKEIEELLDVEMKLRKIKKEKNLEQSLAHDAMECEDIDVKPRFPYSSGPREYQKTAFKNWKSNNQKGLFAMATGTGKTITSLNCLLEIYQRNGYYKAIILVPTITLVDQWEQECKKFRFRHISKICSKNPKWKLELDSIKAQECMKTVGEEPSFIIIATYASFARDGIFRELVGFSRNTMRQILLIADEAHNMGAGRILDKLGGIKFARRIGLSATPERQFDDSGNKTIMNFFGCDNGYTFEFTMREAIDKDFLCRYTYFPHIVHLSDSEMADYMHISLQLAKFFNQEKESFSNDNEILMRLLLKRKRIIHKAKEKERLFKQIIQERYLEKGNLKYTLVYVPEGMKPDDESADFFDRSELYDDDDYSDNLIDLYTKIIQDVSETTTVRKFVSGVRERNEILEKFANGEIEVLTSMKCLDEGVDVPRSEMAIFCASTGNPRQFIQRRGRILRKHPDKHMAVIHDMVVAPEINSAQENYSMERSLIKSELKRVRDFATLSENADYAYNELNEVLSYYNISLF